MEKHGKNKSVSSSENHKVEKTRQKKTKDHSEKKEVDVFINEDMQIK